MINWGTVPLGAVLPFPFASYGKTNGESITLTGLAVTDIECYKGTSVTQRASDAGYALIDTDGIDIDTITGIHGFSIDTGDNTDAGFFVAGSFYWVIISAVTVDSQTVNFIAGTFSLRATESVAGVIESDTTHWLGTAAATPTVGGVPEVDVTHWIGTAAATPTTAGVPEVDATFFSGQAITAAAGVTLPSSVASPTNITAGTITTVTNLTNAPTVGDLTATMKTSVQTSAQAALDAAVSELTTTPAVNASLATMIKYGFMRARNKIEQTATTQTVYQDGGVTVYEASTVSDAAGTFTRGEFATA